MYAKFASVLVLVELFLTEMYADTVGTFMIFRLRFMTVFKKQFEPLKEENCELFNSKLTVSSVF